MEESGGAGRIGEAEGIKGAGRTEECNKGYTPLLCIPPIDAEGRTAKSSAFFRFHPEGETSSLVNAYVPIQGSIQDDLLL